MCPYPRYSRQQAQGFMDWDLYRTIVDELGQMGCEHDYTPVLSYCYMGEVFLAEDLPKYVRYALEQDIEVSLNTNAHPMTPEKVDALLACGFDGKYFVSSHSHNPEVYERIMGLDYETTLSNILYLLDRIDPDRILILGVDDGWPDGEREIWEAYWQPKGVRLEYLAPVSRCGGNKRLLPENLKEQQGVRLYGCRNHLPLYERIILYDGRVVMCCQDMGRKVIWGNVADDGLAGIWNGPGRLDTIKRLYNGSLNSPDLSAQNANTLWTAKKWCRKSCRKPGTKSFPVVQNRKLASQRNHVGQLMSDLLFDRLPEHGKALFKQRSDHSVHHQGKIAAYHRHPGLTRHFPDHAGLWPVRFIAHFGLTWVLVEKHVVSDSCLRITCVTVNEPPPLLSVHDWLVPTPSVRAPKVNSMVGSAFFQGDHSGQRLRSPTYS